MSKIIWLMQIIFGFGLIFGGVFSKDWVLFSLGVLIVDVTDLRYDAAHPQSTKQERG